MSKVMMQLMATSLGLSTRLRLTLTSYLWSKPQAPLSL